MSIVVPDQRFAQAVPGRILKNLKLRVDKETGEFARLAFWDKLCDPRGWGKINDEGKPAWAIAKSALKGGWYGSRLSNELLADHYAGKHPLYISADSYAKDFRYTLAAIDIDAGGRHGKGTAEGALEFFDKEVKPLFGDFVYWERSRNGVGINVYILIERVSRASAMSVRAALDYLEQYLKAKSEGYDIAIVEVKGKPTDYQYELNEVTQSWELVDVVRGSLIRMPTTQDFSKLLSTSLVCPHELFELEIAKPAPKTLPPSPSTPVAPLRPERNLKAGSTGVFLTQADLDKLPTYEKKAQKLLCRFPMQQRVKGGKRVERQDIAIFLLLVEWCRNNPETNQNDTMPHARLSKLWRNLFTDGHVSRSPAHERLSLMRNWASDCGLIEWIDKNFTPPTVNAEGQKVKGQACKWHLNTACLSFLHDANDTHTISVPTTIQLIRPVPTVGVVKRSFLRMLPHDYPLYEYRLAA